MLLQQAADTGYAGHGTASSRTGGRTVTVVMSMLVALALSGSRPAAASEKTPNGGEAGAAAQVELRVNVSLKTHVPGSHAAADRHGTPEYRMLLQVDGRDVPLAWSRQREDREQLRLKDPEAGDGIRYRFSTALKLAAGPHRVTVSLPDDKVSTERQVTLGTGRTALLSVTPVYGAGAGAGRRGQGSFGTASFTKGIVALRLSLNGRPL